MLLHFVASTIYDLAFAIMLLGQSVLPAVCGVCIFDVEVVCSIYIFERKFFLMASALCVLTLLQTLIGFRVMYFRHFVAVYNLCLLHFVTSTVHYVASTFCDVDILWLLHMFCILHNLAVASALCILNLLPLVFNILHYIFSTFCSFDILFSTFDILLLPHSSAFPPLCDFRILSLPHSMGST